MSSELPPPTAPARPPSEAEQALHSLDALAARLRDVQELRTTIASFVQRQHDHDHEIRRLLDDAAALRARLSTTESALRESDAVRLQAEQENASLTSMVVSAWRLHATLDLDEVIRVIEEILLNFIGARAFGVLVRDADDTFRLAAAHEIAERLPSRGYKPDGVIAEAVAAKTARVDVTSVPPNGMHAIVPLLGGDVCVGLVVVYGLLPQKRTLEQLDLELFGWMTVNAGSALHNADLHARADRKMKTLQGMLTLLEDPEAPAVTTDAAS